MPGLAVKKGDKVKVIAGKEKGKEGKVLKALPREGRVIVEGVNLIKRAVRPTQKNPQGGFITKEAPLHVSNVMLICPSCGQPTRVGKKFLESGQKVRVCRKCEASIEKG